MGDRGNIRVAMAPNAEVPDVWFYTHWAGSEMASVLQTALKRQERWDDGPYLARIIFETMIDRDRGGSIGYGIATACCDNEHVILRVVPASSLGDPASSRGQVQALAGAGSEQVAFTRGSVVRSLDFPEFIALDPKALQGFFEPEYSD